MLILDRILEQLPEGWVRDIRIGLHWTAVVVDIGGVSYCGLASTLQTGHDHNRVPDVPQSGKLLNTSAKELAQYSTSQEPVMASLGLATVNALLPRNPESWHEENASEIIAQHGASGRVVMIGHFPFISELRPRLNELIVLEQNPGPDDLPAEAAPDVLPEARIVAITGMTISNHTLEGILRLCDPSAKVILIGPSTPLSPVFFDYGVDIISGAVVMDIEPVLRIISQGGNFHQVHHGGVRLVNIFKSKK